MMLITDLEDEGFNPTLVRLRLVLFRFGSVRSICCFNPTLVRLRRDGDLPIPDPDHKFQSHAGSIEAK
mgnify:CR=1 FL=1